MSSNNHGRDRAFNPWRVSATDRGKELVSAVLSMLTDHEKAKPRLRKRRALDQQRYERLVSSVTLDSAYHHVTKELGELRISRSGRVLNWRSRYNPTFYTQKTLPTLLDSMIETGLITENRGQRGRKPCFARYTNQTTITTGPRLGSLIQQCGITLQDMATSYEGQEIIILKGEKSEDEETDEGEGPTSLIDYEDSDLTNAYRAEVRTINTFLSQANIQLFHYARLPHEVMRSIDTTERFLRRYFTRGKFDRGGRLFGGFWQSMKKEYRKAAILINSQSIEELDYSTMLPRMLYGKVGSTIPKELEEDLYRIPGFIRSRQGIKKLFGAMLFSSSLPKWTTYPKETAEHFHPEELHHVQEVMKAIRIAHHPIKQQFGTGVGHHLQFVESEILIDVLLELQKREIVALPIHDAVLVPREESRQAREIMLRVFEAHVGIDGKVVTSA